MSNARSDIDVGQAVLDFLGIKQKWISSCTILLRAGQAPMVKVTSFVNIDGKFVVDGDSIRQQQRRFSVEESGEPAEAPTPFDLDQLVSDAQARLKHGIEASARMHAAMLLYAPGTASSPLTGRFI